MAGADRGAQTSPPPARARFVFDYPPAPDEFVFELSDPARIEHARKILRGEGKRRIHVSGLIIKKPVAYNPGVELSP